MTTRPSRLGSTFAARFRLDDRVLHKGDTRTGKPSVIGGSDRDTGERVVIKQWRRNPSVPDFDIRAIWRQEMRQLHRVLGYPGAKDRIVPLLDSGEEDDRFYLVLRPGQRLPLHNVLLEVAETHWLHQPKQERNRVLIWQNLRRIVDGLNILHTQGLLHRNLDNSAIYTSGDDTSADFQLSGFEWSIRLSSHVRTAALTNSAISGDAFVHSFLQDWHAFGVLSATLLGVNPGTLTRRQRDDARDIAYYLTGLERSLLILLVRSEPSSRIDGDAIGAKIDDIISSLQAIVAKRDERLYLVPSLGPESGLSKAIREASGRSIESADIDGQIAFLRNDLRESPRLVLAGAHAGEGNKRLLLVGSKLNYRLNPYRHMGPRGRSEPTWEFAYCESVSDIKPLHSDVLGHKVLSGDHIEVMSRNEMNKRFVVLQGKTPRWDLVIADTSEEQTSESAARKYRALLLVQALEALLIASEIWPVEIIDVVDDNGRTRIQVRPRADEEREKLSSALGLPTPAARMSEVLLGDQARFEEDWKLTYQARSVKTPKAAATESVRARLNVEYQWCAQNGIDWKLVDTQEFTRDLLSTLTFMRGWNQQRYEPNPLTADRFAKTFCAIYVRNRPLKELVEVCAKRLRNGYTQSLNNFRYCAWAGLIPVDLCSRLTLLRPRDAAVQRQPVHLS